LPANQTAKATEDIQTQIGGFQTTNKQSVDSIERIFNRIGTISQSSSSIATAMQEQPDALRAEVHRFLAAIKQTS
jgi:methyl-accepting chemotaxis protein